jgi:Transposase DNA-binding/Transposase Tn5 dimerisation domain
LIGKRLRHSEVAMDNRSVQAWAEQNFGSVNLRHRRRTRRLVHAAAAIAALPEKPFNQIFDWNDLRAFYHLCAQEVATVPAIQGPHWEQTRQVMGQQELVLILHDTTELDFTAHTALQGAGPLGDGRGRGFLQHNSLAVRPQPRQVLGLAYQQVRVRQEAPAGEHSRQRKQRHREAEWWLEGITASGRPPQGSCWVDVGDRGSDIYEAMRAAHEVGHAFLFRVVQNRQVWTTAEHQEPAQVVGLRAFACSLPSQGCDQVDIPGRGGRAARTALVQLAAAPVWIPAPDGTPQRWSQPIVAAWVIRIWEANAPPGVEPLEWILVCSLPTRTLEELKTRRDWYGCRWMVEVFHHIEKNGCKEEARRFETAERMAACLAILSVVAVRIFQLRTALESQPEAPAEQVATAEEIQVVCAWHQHKATGLTVRQFVRGVAKLGGFLGRKHDGEPGVLTLWRGYQRLQDLLAGYHLKAFPVAKGRRVIGNR